MKPYPGGKRQLQEQARQIISALLEDETSAERVCSQCEKDHGIIDPGTTLKSHGLCKRHAYEMYREAGFSDQEIREAFATMTFPPDLETVAEAEAPPERVCYECEREFGLSPNNTNSTGTLCKRHLANRYQKMGRPIEARRIQEMPDTKFAPDLSKSKKLGSRAMHPNAASKFQQQGNVFLDKIFGTRQ